MRIVIVSNGNVTVRGTRFCSHKQLCEFLAELISYGNTVEYAALALPEESEKVKNLADHEIPEKVILRPFQPKQTCSLLSLPFVMAKLVFSVFMMTVKADFVYIYYPGALGTLFMACCRLMKRPYGLYVRGELGASRKHVAAIKNAAFIFATGVFIVHRVWPECRNCEEVAPMSEVFNREPCEAKIPVPGDNLRILFVGRCEYAKGVFELLAAVKMLIERKYRFRLVLVGAYGRDVVDKIKVLGISEYVELAGLVSGAAKLDEIYDRADIFCLPSHTEGFPRVLYEAMAHSLPIVTTMVGSIPSRMCDEDNSLGIEVKNPESIADVLERLIADYSLRKRLAIASYATFEDCRKKFRNNSHAKQLTQKLREFYADVAE
ncbi:MAG: glycosyltransferase family 4 protein [Victivallaceae bacterium]|nr:glycosyltransferase [Victivallaceae bacterium]